MSISIVAMTTPDLASIPDAELPPGYTVRPHLAGDERPWTAIHVAVGVYDPLPDDLFTREFGAHADELPRRQLFVVDARSEPVATTTAWVAEEGVAADWR